MKMDRYGSHHKCPFCDKTADSNKWKDWHNYRDEVVPNKYENNNKDNTWLHFLQCEYLPLKLSIEITEVNRILILNNTSLI